MHKDVRQAKGIGFGEVSAKQHPKMIILSATKLCRIPLS